MLALRPIAAALVAAAALAAAPAVAQQADPLPSCFRGRPLPVCGGFWVGEVEMHKVLAQTRRDATAEGTAVAVETFEDVAFGWNVGWMKNVGASYALGTVLSMGEGGPVTALKLRGRRWLQSDVGLDLEAGFLKIRERDGSATGRSARYGPLRTCG